MILYGLIAAMLLLMVIALIQLVWLRKLLKEMTEKMKHYMDVVCQDSTAQTDPLDVALTTPLTKEERSILLPSENDERVFNEVLQEIFQ